MTAPTHLWPGLGFDPAPGDPAAVGGLVTTLSDTARRLQETHDTLAALTGDRGAWEGEAAAAFATTLTELPEYLAGAQESLRRTGDLLDGWQGSLTGYGGRARDLESRAAAVRGDLVGAEGTYEQARRHPDLGLRGAFVPGDERPVIDARIETAEVALHTAARTVARLDTELRDLLRAAETLSDEHRTEARRVADGIRRADDGLTPPEPNWFAHAGDWVMENLGTIGDVAGMVSGVAGALALIPVLTPFAGPIALVAGGVALLAHGADMVVNDKWRDGSAWLGLAGDAVGALPGGRLIAQGAEAGFTAFRNVGTDPALGTLLGAGEGFGRAVTATGSAGDLATAVGNKVAPHLSALMPGGGSIDPTVIARSLQGAANFGIQTPALNEIGGDDFSDGKDTATGLGIGLAVVDGMVRAW